MFQRLKILISGTALICLISGCDNRVASLAREAANRQAQQNTVMAELHTEIASGTNRLVAADAQARKEIVGVHRELQAERGRLDTSWNDLESQRQHIAGQRRTESLLAPIATFIGGLMLVAALFAFCWHALVATKDSDDCSVQLNEILVSEILRDSPLLLDSTDQHEPTYFGQ